MVFQNANIGKCQLKNRIIRSATFEGMCDQNGYPNSEYISLYDNLAASEIGGIITGFSFVSKEGKAIQPGQAGIDSEEKVEAYLPITKAVHKHSSKIFMQLVHAGRQTRMEDTGLDVWGASDIASPYFGGTPRVLTTSQVEDLITKFSQSAYYAKMAGFDGVQLHAAHGYLFHQFILSSVNKRKDIYGIDSSTGIGTTFLSNVIDEIRNRCKDEFPILIKISGGDDYQNNFTKAQFEKLILFLDSKKVDAIEISYGTMDYALNIIRGAIPYKSIFKYNPIYKTKTSIPKQISNIFNLTYARIKTKKFSPIYNLEYSKIAKRLTNIPIVSVGGFRNGKKY